MVYHQMDVLVLMQLVKDGFATIIGKKDLICNFLNIEVPDDDCFSLEDWNAFVDLYIMLVLMNLRTFTL